MSKLFASEALTRQSADFVDLLGPDGIRSYRDPTATAAGMAEYDFRFALGTTTYGGTSEIQPRHNRPTRTRASAGAIGTRERRRVCRPNLFPDNTSQDW